MSIGIGSTWNDEEEEEFNISPAGSRDWLDEDWDKDENISPVGKKDWLEDEDGKDSNGRQRNGYGRNN